MWLYSREQMRIDIYRFLNTHSIYDSAEAKIPFKWEFVWVCYTQMPVKELWTGMKRGRAYWLQHFHLSSQHWSWNVIQKRSVSFQNWSELIQQMKIQARNMFPIIMNNLKFWIGFCDSVSFRSMKISIIVWGNLVFFGLYWPAAGLLLVRSRIRFFHVLTGANRSFMKPGWKTWAGCFTNLHTKPKFYSLTSCWETFNKLDKLDEHVQHHSLSLLPLRSTEEQQLMLARAETSECEWASGQQQR